MGKPNDRKYQSTWGNYNLFFASMSAVTFDSVYSDLQELQSNTVSKEEYELLKNKLESLSDDYQRVSGKLQETSKEALEALEEMETQLRNEQIEKVSLEKKLVEKEDKISNLREYILNLAKGQQ